MLFIYCEDYIKFRNSPSQSNPQRECHCPIPPTSLLKNRSDTGSVTAKSVSKAFSVLYVYDYFLTLGDEVRLDEFY